MGVLGCLQQRNKAMLLKWLWCFIYEETASQRVVIAYEETPLCRVAIASILVFGVGCLVSMSDN